jgi:hypothetical protein
VATIPNTKELTATDGSGSTGDVFNVNTSAGQVEIPNGKNVKFFSDAYNTPTGQILNGLYYPPSSGTGTTAVITSSGTINPANLGILKLAPTAAVTSAVMTTGTIDGQEITLINEANYAITFAASASSNVADGASAIISAYRQMILTWDQTVSLWFH